MVKQHFHFPSYSGNSRSRSSAGFSILELLVAISVFLVIGIATVQLFTLHVPLSTAQKNQSNIDVAMRSVIAQMEMDVANAGTGYFLAGQLTDPPVAITLINTQPVNSCNTGTTYSATCFDTLNVIGVDPAVAPLHPSSSATSLLPVDTSSNTSAYVTSGTMTQAQANTLAALYLAGDELLWVLPGSPTYITTTTLTQPGAAVVGLGGYVVHLTYTATGSGAAAVNPKEKYLITENFDGSIPVVPLKSVFPNATAWVMRLNAIQYTVNSTNSADPYLTRQQGTGPVNDIADQVIGFRVGASLYSTGDSQYNFNASTYPTKYNWGDIQALHISVLARTPAANSGYKNPYDGGAYMIQGVSTTINPRNLSMTHSNQ